MTRRAAAWLLAGLLLTAASLAPAASERPPAPPRRPAASAAPTPEFPSLEAVEQDVARLVESARPSVVGVIVRSRFEPLLDSLGDKVRIEAGPSGAPIARRIGSGVVLDRQGHIVTLASLVSGATQVLVQPNTGDRIGASVKGIDEYSGLAVLVLERQDLPSGMRPVQYSDAGPLRPGSLVTSVSSPFASASGAPSYSFGFVTGTGVSQGLGRRTPYIKFDSFTSPGSGGGPVFDSKGRLAGVLFAAGDAQRRDRGHVIRWDVPTPPAHRAAPGERAGNDDPAELDEQDEYEDEQEAPDPDEDSETPSPARPMPPLWILKSLKRGDEQGGGTAYAIPSYVVKQVAAQIIRFGSVRRGWVGVKIEETEPGEIHLLSVVPGGPADRAGLRAGDRIVSVDGTPVGSAGRLVERIAVSSPGDRISMGIERADKVFDVSLALAETPEPPARVPTAPPQVRAFKLRAPVLGVEVDVDTDDETRTGSGAPEGIGLLVQKVYDGSRAMRAGLKPGDILLEAMGETIRGLEDLRRALRRQGQQIMDVKVMRQRRELTLKVPPDPGVPAPPPAPAPPAPPAPSRRTPPA